MDTSASAADDSAQQCSALRKRDGQPCTAWALADGSGLCFYHSPMAQAGRRQGGAATSRANRAAKLLPSFLRPVVDELLHAFREVHSGALDPRVGVAMAAISSALVRVFTAGQLEERLTKLEANAAERHREEEGRAHA